MEEEAIDLSDLFLAIKNKWKLVVSLTLVCIIIGGVLSFFVMEPVYKAEMTLMVKTEKSDDSDSVSQDQINVSQKLAITYGEIIKSRTVLETVIKNLKLNDSYKALLGKVSVDNIDKTQIIKISVEDTNKTKAAKIANEIPRVFTKEVIRIADANGVEIIDYAKVPEEPIKPRKKLNLLLSAVLGMALGIGIIAVQELFNNKIKRPEDVEKELGLPLLGAVSYHKSKNHRLVCLEDAKSPIAEQYRAIRTSLAFSNIDGKIKTICITSSVQNEGKSTAISNLAVTFSKLGKKVLLIDADLRNPSIHRFFGIKTSGGLTDVLMGDKAFEDCIYHIESMDVMGAGSVPPNPSEILSSNKMMEFMESVKDKYDYVFIDTPPVGIITDAGIVSQYSDAVIFVSAYKHVDIATTKMVLDKLSSVDANVVGVVFNKYKSNNSIYNNYYYYGDDKKRKKKLRLRKSF